MSTQLIVLTGCTRGLGRALLERFVEAGHVVIGCGRDKERIESLTRSYRAPHSFTALNVAQDDEVAAWANTALAAHGPPDLLINNAALMNRVAPLWQLSAQEFDPVIDVNIKGVANVIRHWLPRMVARGNGIVVNFSSGWGRSVAAEVAPYCATKWAIEGLTQALAEELPKGMAAVALNPGIIDTDMLRQAWADGASQYPSASDWSQRAAPYILKLNATDNGRSATVQ